MRLADLPPHVRDRARQQLQAATAPRGPVRTTPAQTTVHLVLPFGLLVPDNARAGVLDGRVLLSRRYRAGKAAVHAHALAALHAVPRPVFPAGGVALLADVWVPDRRRRDLTNLCKSLHDALTGVVYADDAQLADVHYRRAGLDRAAPRVVLTLTLCPEPR